MKTKVLSISLIILVLFSIALWSYYIGWKQGKNETQRDTPLCSEFFDLQNRATPSPMEICLIPDYYENYGKILSLDVIINNGEIIATGAVVAISDNEGVFIHPFSKPERFEGSKIIESDSLIGVVICNGDIWAAPLDTPITPEPVNGVQG